jgi:hypothetical protein
LAIKDVDDGIDLAKRLQYLKNRGACACAEYATDYEDATHLKIDPAAFHMCEHARDAGPRNLRGCGSRSNRWRDTVEYEQRRC